MAAFGDLLRVEAGLEALATDLAGSLPAASATGADMLSAASRASARRDNFGAWVEVMRWIWLGREGDNLQAGNGCRELGLGAQGSLDEQEAPMRLSQPPIS